MYVELKLRTDRCFAPPPFGPSNLFEVPLPPVTKRHSYPERDKSERWNNQYRHASAQSPLALLGGCGSRAIAHSTSLPESWRGPEEERSSKNGGAQSHFALIVKIRRASGKKIIIKARQTTSEHIVSHFIREISYFMCMK